MPFEMSSLGSLSYLSFRWTPVPLPPEALWTDPRLCPGQSPAVGRHGERPASAPKLPVGREQIRCLQRARLPERSIDLQTSCRCGGRTYKSLTSLNIA